MGSWEQWEVGNIDTYITHVLTSLACFTKRKTRYTYVSLFQWTNPKLLIKYTIKLVM